MNQEAKFKVGQLVHETGWTIPYVVVTVQWNDWLKSFGYELKGVESGKIAPGLYAESVLHLYENSEAQWKHEGRKLYAQAQEEIARLRKALEYVQQVAIDAQGEWSAVNGLYTPEWTSPYKEIVEAVEVNLTPATDKPTA